MYPTPAPRFTGPLNVTQSVTLDANGNGTIVLAPARPYEEWHVTSTSIRVDNSATVPSITLFNAAQSTQIDTSKLGLFNTSGVPYTLHQNEQLFVTWSGGDPGGIGTVSLIGTDIIP